MVDRQMASIGSDLQDDLGHWIRRKLGKGVEGQGKQAEVGLKACGIMVDVLREQWKIQQAAQLSVRAREYHLPFTLGTSFHSLNFKTHLFGSKEN